MAMRRKARGPARLAAALGFALAVCAALSAAVAERRLARLVAGGLGMGFSTKVYSAPFELRDGGTEPPSRLMERLGRLQYRRTDRPAGPGEYAWEPPRLTVQARGFKTPLSLEPARRAVLSLAGGRWRADGSTGTQAMPAPGTVLMLEPELVAELSGPEKVRREPATLEEFPQRLRDAAVATEDKRFYRHHGVDVRAILRSLWYNLVRRGVWGGSTITQQLAKNLFLTPRRALSRKIAEAGLAFYLELRYDKGRILTLYLNHVYLGQDGSVGVAGMRSAARFYFGRELRRLDLPECALLAGLIRSPYLYNPRRDPYAAKARRDFVLGRMREEGMISGREHDAAVRTPLRISRGGPRPASGENDYFVAEVVRQILSRHEEDELLRGGLAIHTTLDPLLQRAALRAVRLGRYQAALVALEPGTGRVPALVGGRDFSESQYNRATQARRQPGSAFKPFVYGAALEAGFTPATLLIDEPRRYPKPSGGAWEPRNYDGVYLGTATLRVALARSLNAATLDLTERLGPAKVVDFARRAGIRSPLEASLAIALGASEVNLLELSAAYAAFANGGLRVLPRLVTAITDPEGNVLEYAYEPAPGERAVEPAPAYLMTSLLESVVREGTAVALAQAYAWDRPAAGKTGTTNDGRDAWFIGYTPRLLAGVWTGEDSNRALGVTGAKDALPLWVSFMKEALRDAPPEEFRLPERGLVKSAIDPDNGLLAVSGCLRRKEEVFIAGTEPREICPLHSRGVLGWLKRLFRR